MDDSNGDRWPNRHMLIMQRLRERRMQLGLTQKQVVTRLSRCGVNTTNRALSSLEHGAGVDIARLPELATALDCTVTYLIGLTVDPHRWEPDRPVTTPTPAVSASDAVGVQESAAALILGTSIPERRARTIADLE